MLQKSNPSCSKYVINFGVVDTIISKSRQIQLSNSD